jgi:RimJ/RimL family protein N-acetyltransferase
MNIRSARVEEAEALASVAGAAKAHWGYLQAQLEAWREDLSPSAVSIAEQPTFVAEVEGQLAGFCQLNRMADLVELEHLWVHPRFMGRGIGRALLARCLQQVAAWGVEAIHIDSDPNAEPFYKSCGAVRVGERPAPIEGEPARVRPQLRLSTRQPMPPALDFPDAVPELRGDLVLLRELTEDDVPAWFERASDPESALLAGDPIPASIDEGFQWLRRNRERFRQQAGIRWAIVPVGTTQSVGSIGLAISSQEERTAELGFVVGRAHWGRGLSTAAGRLVTRYAFDRLHLAEIRAELLASNLASRRVLKKLGFRFLRVIPDFEPSGSGFLEGHLYVLQKP